jgi:cobalt-zinc-cadmium efflux system protein
LPDQGGLAEWAEKSHDLSRDPFSPSEEAARPAMSHYHHEKQDFGRAFAVGIILNTGFIVAEVGFGLLSHSLTLLADAGHNLSDVLGLVVAWAATNLQKRRATQRYTYGLRRSSVLAALFNALLLLVSVGAIAWEAIRRLVHPEPVGGLTIIWVAAAGVVINGVTAWMFMSGRKSDLNIRGAFLHMAADAGVSVGVVVAGVIIFATGWSLLDPIVSLVIVAIILLGTWGLFHDSLNLALDAVPAGIDLNAVKRYLEGLPEVAQLHHLHVWGLSTTETACTAHIVKREPHLDDQLLKQIAKGLHERFGIAHTTVQFEACSEPECPMESKHSPVVQ